MNSLSFDETIGKFDLIVSSMGDADKKNDLMFRKICCEVFQNSYSKLELKNNLNLGVKLLTGKIIFAFMKNKKRNKVTRAKSLRKLNSNYELLGYSNLNKACNFLKTSEFSLVIKSLKIQYNYGLIKAISTILE